MELRETRNEKIEERERKSLQIRKGEFRTERVSLERRREELRREYEYLVILLMKFIITNEYN